MSAAAPRVVPVTTDTTATYGDLILADATAGAIAVTLPASAWGQRTVAVKKTDATVNTVTVTRAGVSTIDGATTAVLADQYARVEVTPDGTDWWITG